AHDLEQLGKLERARQAWQSILDKKDTSGSEERIWGLMAERRVHVLDEALGLEERLRVRMNLARNDGQHFKGEGDAEQLAADALRYEEWGDRSAARLRWLGLRMK